MIRPVIMVLSHFWISDAATFTCTQTQKHISIDTHPFWRFRAIQIFTYAILFSSIIRPDRCNLIYVYGNIYNWNESWTDKAMLKYKIGERQNIKNLGTSELAKWIKWKNGLYSFLVEIGCKSVNGTTVLGVFEYILSLSLSFSLSPSLSRVSQHSNGNLFI